MKKVIDDATIYFIALYVYNSFCNWTSKQPCLLLCVSDFCKLKKYSHRKVTRCAHDYTAGNPERGPGVPWGSVQHSSHLQGKQLVPRTLADRRLKQEEAEGLQVQSLASGFQDSQLPRSWPFSIPWMLFRFSISMKTSYSSFPALSLSLLTPTKDWNWLSALGLATVIAAFVNKLRIYRNPLFAVSTLCTWEQSNGSAGSPWLRMHKRANE